MITAKIEGVVFTFDSVNGWKATESPGSNLEAELTRLWAVRVGLEGYTPDADLAHVRAVLSMFGGTIISRVEEPDEHDDEVVY